MSSITVANPTMELEDIIQKLAQTDVRRGAPDIQLWRSVVSCCWKTSKKKLTEELSLEMFDLATRLLYRLTLGSMSFEEQLICSTAFCALLGMSVNHQDAVDILNGCLPPMEGPATLLISFILDQTSSLSINNPVEFQLGLSYGFLQCKLCHFVCVKPGVVCADLLMNIFNVLQKSCKEYSKFTIVAFRGLVKWLHLVIEINEQNLVVNNVSRAIFAIVNNNWESPISGIRKENQKLFELLIDACNTDKEDIVFSVKNLLPTILEEQPWKMKSKYFMLAVLVPRYGVISALTQFPGLAKSLVLSVHHTHLVSAGCDTYLACLKHIHQQSEWCNFFLDPVLQVLCADTEDDVGKENLYNYWLKSTIKRFPDILWELLKVMVTSMESKNASMLLPIISLVYLGRKEGLINNLWDDNYILDLSKSWHVNLLNSALQHSNETIRNYAFGAVCVCSKRLLIPSEQELQTVRLFLMENANADSAPLRQGILNSFVTFLLRMQDSFPHELKNTDAGQSPLLRKCLEFLEWLYSFIISNLKPGANYQRKILSLRLFQEVLRYLDEEEGKTDIKSKRKGSSLARGVKVKDFAVQNNMWQFDSEASRTCLLECLKDPTDDIRKTAGNILMDHFGNRLAVHIEDTEELMKKALNLCSSPLFYEAESGATMMKVITNALFKGSRKIHFNEEDISLMTSRLAFREQATKPACLNTLKIVEEFEKLSFFDEKNDSLDGPFKESTKMPTLVEEMEEEMEVQDEEEDEIEVEEEEEEIQEEEEQIEFCASAQKLLDGLKAPEAKSPKNINNKNTKYSPGTYEGLQVRKDESMPMTFEGMSVVHPSSGEVGQHLNFPRPEKQASPTKCVNKNAKVSESQPQTDCSELYKSEFQPMSSAHRSDQRTVLQRETDPCPERQNVDSSHSGAQANSKHSLSNQKRTQRKLKVANVPPHSLSENRKGSSSHHKPRRRRRSRPNRRFALDDNDDDDALPNLNVPESRDSRFRESLPVSPAPSLDWDVGGDLLQFDEGELLPYSDPIPVMLADTLGENAWWEVCIPECVMSLLLYHCWSHWHAMCEDMFGALTTRSPLHGMLSAMTQVLDQDVPVIGDQYQEIVYILEDVVKHMLRLLASKAPKTCAVPSFAEMSAAIDYAIRQSYVTTEEDTNNDEQISPAHQLMLNCLWLNLKACCQLASELVKYKEVPAILVKRCEQVIVQVLLKCRHKGAIEAAGTALGSLVRIITSPEEDRVLVNPDGSQMKVDQLPTLRLKEFFESIENITSNVSTTRRSAGLTILVHKILANDMQPGKPLVEKCVSVLLNIARSPVTFSGNELEQLTCDLPQAQALHFLCTLMQDSSLRQDMAPYISDTTLLCFENFSSPIWPIRNASLQLFGALVPKLVGEKKFQDDDSESYGNITVEEFTSHYPELVKYLLTALANNTQHSNLVPVLSLLSKLSVGGYSLMEDHLKQNIERFNKYFINLLPNSIFAIRKTAAKAFARFVELAKIPDMVVMFIKILGEEQPNENEIHGILLVMKYLKERLLSDCSNLSAVKLENDLKKIFEINYIDSISWLNKALIAEVCGIGFITHNNQENVDPSVLLKQILYTLKLYSSGNKLSIGIYHWALVEAELVFKTCHQGNLRDLWLTSYHSNWDELPIKYLSILESRWCQLNIENKALLFETLIDTVVVIHWLKPFDLLYHIYSTLLTFAKQCFLGRNVDLVAIQTIYLQNNAKAEMDIRCWSSVLPLTCSLLAFQTDTVIKSQTTLLYQMTRCIVKRTNASSYDELCRLDAAIAFASVYQIVSRIFTSEFRTTETSNEMLVMAQDISEMMLDAGIALLQDEDSDVRKEAAKFLGNQLNPYTCLEKLVEPASIMNVLSHQQAMIYICNKLINLDANKQTLYNLFHGKTSSSPFNHGTSNIYAEEVNVVHLLGDNLLLLIEDATLDMRYELDLLLPTTLIEEDLNFVLSCAVHGKKSGLMNATARGVLHVIDEKLNYLLKVKEALTGLYLDHLQHITDVYHEYLQHL